MPITHEWNGTILTITSDSGTSSADLKGEKGDDGARGVKGEAGDCVATDTAMLGGVPAAEYALKLYVDDAISKIETGDVDLTNYATKTYVDEAISNIETGEADLTNYYTKAETNTAITNATNGYLLKTETAANANKLGGIAAAEYALKADIPTGGGSTSVAYNLLDNSDFRNPINQRKQTTYNGAGYTIDRWRSSDANSVITVNKGYVSHTADLTQYIVGLDKDTTYTFAVKNTNGDILTITAKPSENNSEYHGLNIFYDENIGVGLRVWYNALNENLIWACLYEGTYTAETLPPYVPKGYTTELLECQRYFFPLNTQSICFGSTNASKSAFYGDVFTPSPMIKAPTVQSANNKYYLTNNGSQVAVNNTLSVNTIVGNKVQLFIRIDNLGMTASIVAKMWADTDNTYIYLNSEL